MSATVFSETKLKSVKEGNLVREGAVRDAERPGQAKVSQFDASVDINKKILRLEVAVYDSVTVTVRYAVQQLVQVTLHIHKISK